MHASGPESDPTSYVLQDSLERHPNAMRGFNLSAKSPGSHHHMDSMVNWLENVPENEL